MPDNHKIQTKKQKRATVARCLVDAVPQNSREKFGQLAKKFPALVHTCGLAEATAFVKAKEGETGRMYLTCLISVMELIDVNDLHDNSISIGLTGYQNLTRNALDSATWIKRYSEAIFG